MNEKPSVDLGPSEFHRTGERPGREPFLNPGWKWGLLALITAIAAKGLIYFIVAG